ncbi:CPBP family intramembrane glutamic endopeptidase [Acetobacter fallax]|uniref:CPBP family intramembrane metalloprotease n=1 Tax=Acetobacter fallax TaxID=1737473 RepID=A0ABX0K989_9PROT|nr:CPBP family intramembrane glutamic endopeptidase [Acetobacter fallax]NHO31761.1 CPBP family intramembrane metalloprotease [Acetobacter fallax]NHO35320.1 CPBP family intramembrane metalloprotease [Acetobacter fallax]
MTPPEARPAAPYTLTKLSWRTAEFLLVFIGGPLLILDLRRPGLLFAALWIGASVAWFSTRTQTRSPHNTTHELKNIFIRFAVLAPLIALASWWLWPETFLILPRQKPRFWAMIMVLYPLLSVWPQEMLYRQFLFTRYAPLFRKTGALIAASAISFGFAHIIFLNPIAIVMTVIGGFLFARDYSRHRSLRFACLEHSLYGCLIFTVGLGRFFYTGAAWHHH